MPYVIRRTGDRYCVYTEGSDGQPEGSAHGCHDTEAEARAQQRALYARAPKSLSGTETKHVTTTAELKADGEEGALRAVFSTFNVVDRGGDVVTAKAFKDGQEVPMVWAHQWDKPIGKGVVKVTPSRAIFEGRFFLDTAMGQDAYRTVRNMGGLQQYSWGFRITDHELGQKDGEEVRFIKGAEVFEVSPVLVGEGLGTRTLAIKQRVEPVDPPEEPEGPEPESEPDGEPSAELKVGRRISRQTESHIRAALEALTALLDAEAEAAGEDEGKSAGESLVAAGERLSGELAGYVARLAAAPHEDLRKDRDALAGFSRRLSARQAEVDRALATAIKAEDAGPQELRRQYQELVARLGLPH